jgi:membrane protein required for beta-lactamase induction
MLPVSNHLPLTFDAQGNARKPYRRAIRNAARVVGRYAWIAVKIYALAFALVGLLGLALWLAYRDL